MYDCAFRIIGSVIVASFYAAYIGKQLSLRRRGVNANRLARGVKPRKTRRIEVALLVVTLLMPAAQYAAIFTGNAALPLVKPTPAFMQFAGAVVSFVGFLYFALALSAMRGSWRAGIDSAQKTEFVSRGIYRLSRNPAFVGFNLFYIGTAMMFPNAVSAALTIAAAILFHLQILEEERYLAATFGAEYEEYRKTTMRY